MVEVQYLWRSRIGHALVADWEESAVYLEASQGVVSFKDASTGYLQPIRLVSSYTAGDSPLHFGIVRDDLRQYFVAVYAHGFVEKWCIEPTVQLEHTFSWKTKARYDLATVSSRTGDMIGFFAQQAVPTSIQCVRLDSGAVLQIRLDMLSDRPKGNITHMLCHPHHPWLAIGYSRGGVQIWNYSTVLSKTATGMSNGDGYGGGAGGAGASGVDALDESAAPIANAQMKLIALAQLPPGGDLTHIDFHPAHSLLLAVVAKISLSVFDLGGAAAAAASAMQDDFGETGSVVSGVGKDKENRAAPIIRLDPVGSTASIPRNWNLVSARFDSKDPVVVSLVQRSVDLNAVGSHALALHTIMEPAMRICAAVALNCPVTHLYGHRASGRWMCVVPSATGSELCAVDLSYIHINRSPPCTPFSLPPESFTQPLPSGMQKFVYYIRQLWQTSATGLRPLATSFAIYRHRLATSTLRKATQRPELCAQVPPVVTASSKLDSPQIPGTLPEGPFVPLRLASFSDGSCFAVCGHVLTPVSSVTVRAAFNTACVVVGIPDSELADPELMATFAACSVTFNEAAGTEHVSMRTVVLPMRDAFVWQSPQRGETLICLSQDGDRVFWLARDCNVLHSWETKVPLLRMFGAATLRAQPLFLVSFAKRGTELLCVSPTPEINLGTARSFQSRPDEHILDAQWQPVPSVYLQGSGGPEAEALRPWLAHRSGPLVACLTSQRVLILTPLLEILTQFDFVQGIRPVTSISWLGVAVVMQRSCGAVEYLVPSHLPEALVDLDESSALSSPYMGRLCTLPANQCSRNSARVVVVLPDRLLYAWEDASAGTVILNRPCIPVEPLALGLVASARPISCVFPIAVSPQDVPDPHLPQRELLLKTLLFSYTYPKQAYSQANASSEHGAHPKTHATRHLVTVLHNAGYTGLAGILAGLQSSTLELGQKHEMRSWLPRETKLDIAIALQKYDEGILEVLGSDPGLQELYVEPESLGGGGLPHPMSKMAHSFRQISRALVDLGVCDTALKLADMAGDDGLFGALMYSFGQSSSAAATAADLGALASSNENRNPHLAAVFEAMIRPSDPNDPVPTHVISTDSVSGSARRPALFVPSNTLRRANVSGGATTADYAALENEHSQMFMISGMRRVGPLNKGFDVPAADSLEDYAGRSVLECLEEDGPIVVSSTTTRTTPEVLQGMNGAEVALDAVDKSTWIEGIGRGRGDDRVVGYWRFGDIAKPNQEGFVTTCLPPARANIPDISRYANVGELLSEGAPRVRVAESTSPIDQGEKNVKPAYDVVFSPQPIDAREGVLVGVRCNALRGGPFDIGMFHEDPNRAKLTVELWVRREPDCALNEDAPHVLAARVIPADDGRRSAMALWMFSVDNQGRLVFTLGGNLPGCDSKHVAAIEEVKTPNACIAPGTWTHIAVTVDTSLSEYVPMKGGKPTERQRAAVTLFVNATREAGGTLMVPTVPEDKLKQTLLYLGYNLRNWRFTEVRLWATVRTELELGDTKENYLQLASNTRRLTIKMSGEAKRSSFFQSTPSGPMAHDAIPAQPNISSSGIVPLPAPTPVGIAAPMDGNHVASSAGLPPPGAAGIGGSFISAPGDANKRRRPRRSMMTEHSNTAVSTAPGAISLHPPPSDEGQYSSRSRSMLAPLEESGQHSEADEQPIRPNENVSAAETPSQAPTPTEDIQIPTRPPPRVPMKRPPALPAKAPSTLSKTIGRLSDAELTMTDACRDIRAPFLSGGRFTSVAVVSGSEENIGLCVLELQYNAQTLQFYRYKIAAESAIMSPDPDLKLVAMYARGVLAVFDVDQKRKLVEQKMSAPLVFWRWLNSTTILVATSVAVFEWAIPVRPDETPSPPRKLCDRADIDRNDPQQWAQRRILHVGRSADSNWVIVLSCERHRPERIVNQQDVLDTSRLVIHHVGTGVTRNLDVIAAAFLRSEGIPAVVLVQLIDSLGTMQIQRYDLSEEALASDDGWMSAQQWTTQLPIRIEGATTFELSSTEPGLSAGAWVCSAQAVVSVVTCMGALYTFTAATGDQQSPAGVFVEEGILHAATYTDTTEGSTCIAAVGRRTGTIHAAQLR